MTNEQRETPNLAGPCPPRKWTWLAIAAAVLLTSCSGRPGRVHPPDYSASAGADAVSRYDTNRDGAIGGNELEGVPGLKAALKQVDTDDNGQLTAQEIDARIQSWRNSRVAEMPVNCHVLLDGKPLVGAQLQFEPEALLGATVRPAQATTDAGGSASVSLAAEDLADSRYPGVACGWYKIRVRSNDRVLPARYNTATTLGCEVAMNAQWVSHGAVEIELQSQ